jgi:hypothetical protein
MSSICSYFQGTQVISDELPISIRGSTVDVAHSYTKKKHVFRLCTQNNCEHLLQADDHESMMSWIHAIQAAYVHDEEVRFATDCRALM